MKFLDAEPQKIIEFLIKKSMYGYLMCQALHPNQYQCIKRSKIIQTNFIIHDKIHLKYLIHTKIPRRGFYVISRISKTNSIFDHISRKDIKDRKK